MVGSCSKRLLGNIHCNLNYEKRFKKIFIKGVAGSRAKLPAAKNNWAFLFSRLEWRTKLFSGQRSEETDKLAVGISQHLSMIYNGQVSLNVGSMWEKTNSPVDVNS